MVWSLKPKIKQNKTEDKKGETNYTSRTFLRLVTFFWERAIDFSFFFYFPSSFCSANEIVIKKTSVEDIKSVEMLLFMNIHIICGNIMHFVKRYRPLSNNKKMQKRPSAFKTWEILGLDWRWRHGTFKMAWQTNFQYTSY